MKIKLPYNANIGCPMLSKMNSINSTYNLKMKLLTNNKIREVWGEQVLARKYYVQELKNGGTKIHIAKNTRSEEKIVTPRTFKFQDWES